MTPTAQLAETHGTDLTIWRLVNRLRCRAPLRNGARCRAKPNLITLVVGRERRKDFHVIGEITVLDERPRNG